MNLFFLALAQSAAESAPASAWFSSSLSVLVVIIFFGFCIFIHELGHFLAARWRGLHVIAFSIGFKKIWSFKRNGVEYRIGCLPFGGYVDLPQVDSSEDVPKDEKGNDLPRAKPTDRMIVALAGPACNIIFGLLLAIPIWFHGLIDDTPRMNEIIVNDIDPASNEYLSGLRNGDTITAVDGQKFYGTWNDFATKILFHTGTSTLQVTRPDGSDTLITYVPGPNEARMNKSYPFFTPVIPATVFPLNDSAAAKAGIIDRDIIVAMAVNGAPRSEILKRSDVTEHLAIPKVTTASIPVKVWVKREGKLLTKPFEVAAQRNPISYEPGFELSAEYFGVVKEARDSALFQPGDRLLAFNGKTIRPYRNIEKTLTATDSSMPLIITLLRAGKVMTLSVLPCDPKFVIGAAACTFDYEIGYVVDRVLSGSDAEEKGLIHGAIIFDPSFQKNYSTGFISGNPFPLTFVIPKDGTDAVHTSILPNTPYQLGVMLRWIRYPSPFEQLGSTIDLTAKTLKGLFNQKSNISINDMSGPVNIINIVQKVSRRDMWSALNLIVMISFSLGIFNLLPVPILDGGHICFAGIQLIIRRPIPSRILRPVMFTFFVLLIGLMVYITGNDVYKVSGEFRDTGPQPFEAFLIPVK